MPKLPRKRYSAVTMTDDEIRALREDLEADGETLKVEVCDEALSARFARRRTLARRRCAHMANARIRGFYMYKVMGWGTTYVYCLPGHWYPRVLVGQGGYVPKVFGTMSYIRRKFGKWVRIVLAPKERQ